MNQEIEPQRKTGAWGRPWVDLSVLGPKPPRVDDIYRYWGEKPPHRTERCAWWVAAIAMGWRPNASVRRNDLCDSASWYGVYIWEYQYVLSPMIYADPGRSPGTPGSQP